jgi:subtilisin family serine protease
LAVHAQQRPRLLAVALLVLVAAACPYTPAPPAVASGAPNPSPGGATLYAGGRSATLPDPQAPAPYIVMLRTPPVASQRGAGRSAAAQRVSQAQASLRSALLGRGLAQEVRAPLRYLINALPISARPADRAAIAALPDVAGVYPDYELRAADAGDDGSIARVGAPALWAQGADGQGITVAVIDSGVDYTHPDLGGCLGPGCKVRGGYDLVYDDADPRDDNGHGTHVAGIVAANGATTGVAPEAALLAYKVLNSLGAGPTSRIIAGLERAADPDGDPNTDDAPDVINMSLGGPGSPDDPLSQAVDGAVAQGIVVVVSAGNEGADGYGSVGSPGAAPAAITVGATDAADAPTDFSSLGPAGASQIKPDLMAPGSQIRSTVPASVDASGYARMSGTSMASPHVAGLAALLRQRHPRWRPADIKASLMGSAQPLALSPFVVGSGRARGDAADKVTALVQPPSLSLGLVDDSVATWAASATLTISNTSGGDRTFQIAAVGLPPGATAQVSATLKLRKGESGSLPVTLLVDTSALPVPAAAPYAYHGAITIAGDGMTQRVPLAFVRAAQLRLDWGDDPPQALYVHDRGARGVDALRTFNMENLTLPPGLYDVMAVYDQSRVALRQAVDVRGSAYVKIRPSDASVALRTALLRPDGQRSETSPIGATWSLLHTASRAGLVFRSAGAGAPQRLLLSPAPGYTYESHRLAAVAGARYDLAYRAGDVVADRALELDARDFTPVRYRYAAPPGAERLLPFHIAVAADGRAFQLAPGAPLTAPFEEQIWRAPQEGNGWFLPYRAAEVYSASSFSPERLLYATPLLDAGDGAGFGAYDAGGHPLYRTSDALPVGFGPVLWTAPFANTADTVVFGGAGERLLADQWANGYPVDELPYTLDGAAHREGALGELAAEPCVAGGRCLEIAGGGPQRLTIPYRAALDGYDGWAEGALTAEFDLSRADRNPPTVRDFALEAGAPRALAAGDAATLRLRIADDVSLAGVQVYADTGSGWQAQPVSADGDTFSVRFTGLAPLAAVSLKIVAEDASGNRLTNELRPAFVGGLPEVSLSAPPRVPESAGEAVVTVALSHAAPQPVAVDYAARSAGATAGGDFAAAAGRLVFAPGETSKRLAIAIRDDTLREGDESFVLALSSPQRALLPSPADVTITILDDDALTGTAPTPAPEPKPAPGAFRVYLPLVGR